MDERFREASLDAADPTVSALCRTVQADLLRLGVPWSYCNLVKAILTQREFRPVFTLRLCQGIIRQPTHPSVGFRVRRRLLAGPAKALHWATTHVAAMDLPWDVDVGPGLQLVHGRGLVVSPGARLGANCTLFHGVTIGRNEFPTSDGHVVTTYPVIEDGVWIGPHAVVVGAVRVGQGAGIAAGTFVTRNVPPFTLVAGNPMVKVRRFSPPTGPEGNGS